ncbi:cytochrome b/b6 domain-containing protein [Arthrobacter sp. ES3-54]|uniref:cytochrome b/b6 domain-containing protein n=1 Tax=Arthrobacter sp. ES3-54 TaxID=1502991 RepID=UPI003217E67D|nr:thiosulfate reductase cytochrome b subunit [Arthrobacter sp. ES3-54]
MVAAAAAPAVQAGPEQIAQAPAPAASVAETGAEAVSIVETVAAAEPLRTASAPAVTAAPASAAPAAAQKPAAAEKPVRPQAEARLYGSRTLGQWIKLGVLLALGAVAAAGILVLAARGVTTLPGVPEFLERYPGVYQLPDTAEPGFPWWAQWAHFFNIFLMVLIIRSGYQVRTEQKPPAFWTPNRGGKKISINLWLHQSLDILWLANGLIFVVLLFATGRWMRIVPSSWEAFPNALSALLQYMTLDWPVESGWVNYNSLQQIMYFVVVFIAAPLAAITGVRMSEFWPKDEKTLNKVYPVEVARAIHFPTMLFFVLFILIHVFLVFATGALRNLNHMFGGTDEVNWVGFWLFAAAIAITAAGWYAARPLVLAPIAKLFGQVSSR